ncbi:MAG: FAD-dependent oxidoreductase [Rhizobiales bacterium]|nr:FAD-dependent oxidoreductase [Hyphomicrobiales bacterium]
MMPGDFEALLSPVQVGPLTMRNRVLVTAHVPGFEKDGLVNDDYIAYQRARARGGAALQVTGASAVHRTGSVGGGRALDLTKGEIVEGFRRLADAIHGEGGRFLVQLGHSAATVNDTDAGRPLWAPSAVASQLSREMPYAMSLADIDEIVEAHGVAARRVADGGLDGVEILAAFGYLGAAFLSPYSNKRTDEYGGGLDNRMRFLSRVIAVAREAVGRERIVGVRLPGDERVPGGLGPDELAEIARRLAATGQIDYLNIIVGTNYDRLQRMEHWPPTPAPHGLFVPLAAAIKRVVAIPVFTTGRIVDARMANAVIASGEADMVGMTRAHISDPDLVAKIAGGRAEDVRPCVGANVCIARATEGKVIRCFHNPNVGREAVPAALPGARTEKARHVVVVGGGPAGLEAARRAAERGHRVSLYEASSELGGQLRVWARAPLTAEFGRTIEWYEGQLARLQVQVHRNRRLAPADLGELGADAIIFATGSVAIEPAAPAGHERSSIRLMTPAELIDAAPRGVHIVLADEGGGRGGLSAVDAVLDGNRVTIASSDNAIGELVNPNLRTPLYKRLLGAGAVFRPNEVVTAVDGRRISTRNIYSDHEGAIEDADILVDWRGNVTLPAFAEEARTMGIEAHVIGDCLAPRQVHVAIAEGALVAEKI